MGVTVFYRGRLNDRSRIEDFEDRVLDLALELGGQAKLWRSSADTDPARVVRGLLIRLCPGQETLSLLVSPEGWLVGLVDIEPAERGELDEAPWCFVKTQFGTLEGHVALVETLAALKREFITNLEVRDEGEYWETRNLDTLRQKLAFLQAAIDQFAQGLKEHGLTREAAEDPEILIARITRIAQVVQQKLRRPAEHPPVEMDEDDLRSPADPPVGPESKARWDASYKEDQRRQERLHRAIEERLVQGASYGEAFEAALQQETALGLPEEASEMLDEDPLEMEGAGGDEGDLADGADAEGDHPLQRRATDLLLRLYDMFDTPEKPHNANVETLLHSVCEISGGLAQALGSHGNDGLAGLAIVQLKRALRGAAFAQGALFPLRDDGTLDRTVFEEIGKALDDLQTDIFAELARVRQGFAGENGHTS